MSNKTYAVEEYDKFNRRAASFTFKVRNWLLGKKADISTIRAQAPTYDKEKDGSSYEIRISLIIRAKGLTLLLIVTALLQVVTL